MGCCVSDERHRSSPATSPAPPRPGGFRNLTSATTIKKGEFAVDALLSEASLGNPEITTVGIELDGLVANLLTALGATVPTEFTV